MGKEKTKKPAYVENIILWMVMFVGFAWIFFFIIDYAKIVRVKDNMDALSDYAVRMIANNGTGATSISNIVTNLNSIKVDAVNTIVSANIVCNSVIDAPPTYQVIFTTETTNNSYEFFNNKLTSSRAVFNEVDTATVTCTLTVTLSN